MAKLPILPELVQRKLAVHWEELADSHYSYLDLHEAQLTRAEIRTGYQRVSYEMAMRDHLIKKTISLAETRFGQNAEEYLRVWASDDDARAKDFAEWLDEIKVNAVSEIAKLWATRNYPTSTLPRTTASCAALFQSACRGRVEDQLSGLVQVWKSRARRLEIQHLEYPHLSLESLVASGGNLSLALTFEQGKKTVEFAQEVLNRLNAGDPVNGGKLEGSEARETSGIGDREAEYQKATPDPFADSSRQSLLGENPFPREHPFRQPFQNADWETDGEMTKLNAAFFLRRTNTTTAPELAKLLFAYRLARFDVIATKGLGSVVDLASMQAYEHWLREFAKFEGEDILKKLALPTMAFPDKLLRHLNADGLKQMLVEKVEQHTSKALAIVEQSRPDKPSSHNVPDSSISVEESQAVVGVDPTLAAPLRKRGFEPDMVEHSRTAGIVQKYDGHSQSGSTVWRRDAILKLICSDLDQAEIDIPKGWRTGETVSLGGVKLTNWSDALTLGYKKLVVDNVRYHLKMVRRNSSALSAKA